MFEIDDLRNWREDDEYFVNKWRSRLEQEQVANDTLKTDSGFWSLSGYEAALGAANLWLGNYEKARDRLSEASAFTIVRLYDVLRTHRAGNPHGDWGQYVRRSEEALLFGILGGDSELQRRVIELIRHYRESDAGDSVFKYWRHRAHTLAAIVDDDPETARTHLEEMTALADQESVDERDDPLRRLYEGLIEEDEQTIEAAAADLAAIREDVFEPPPSDCLDFISLPAVAGIALARRRGLAVTVEADAIPPVVCEHDWAHREADLSELAQETLDDVDAHELPG